jgi:hypothetical protein
VLLLKLNVGDVSDCGIVALVERTAFGEDRGDEVVVTKSPDVDRFVVVLHPAGNRGEEVESNRSTYEVGMTCACAQHGRMTHTKKRRFMTVSRIYGVTKWWTTADPSSTVETAEMLVSRQLLRGYR